MGGAYGSGRYRFVGQEDWRSWWGLVGGVVRGWWEGLVVGANKGERDCWW